MVLSKTIQLVSSLGNENVHTFDNPHYTGATPAHADQSYDKL